MDAETRLQQILRDIRPVVVAVSGGVDSMTLMSFAYRVLGVGAVIAVHAVSPAVPKDATARLKSQAVAEGWRLKIIDAGEMGDPRYRANPVNRCFFCKNNLYTSIKNVTVDQIVSGTNLDDLGEYRPGLQAAREFEVRHPFLEAQFSKPMIRALARKLGLREIAELPASPCLSSRVETGLSIDSDILEFVHKVENMVASCLEMQDAQRALRCRVRSTGVVIELDPKSFQELNGPRKASLAKYILAEAPAQLQVQTVMFARYRNGSAFLTTKAARA
jgi:uncharacterized protein